MYNTLREVLNYKINVENKIRSRVNNVLIVTAGTCRQAVKAQKPCNVRPFHSV